MKNFSYTIKDELGIHARPAGLFVKNASTFSSTITVSKESKTVDAKKLFAMMSLGAKCGETIAVEISGEDEEEAFTAIQAFLNENL